jgi:hypothetical protein
MIDHGKQIGGAAVVEVRRMLPKRAQRCRPVRFRRAARCRHRILSDLGRGVQERHILAGSTGWAQNVSEQGRLVASCASGGAVEQFLTTVC